ncbi:MAG: dTMP kinase [Candidatus Dormiibacterota bacterium]
MVGTEGTPDADAVTGFFISVEGVDGSGKTTQAGQLAESLSRDGHQVQVVRDPGTTALGERLRALLLEPAADWALEGWAETALFLAGRVQLTAEVVRPALESGAVVISDRYIDSSLVYQGARSIPWEAILELHRICGADLKPDLTLILDLEISAARGRREGQPSLDRLESEPTTYHEKVRAGYLEVARRFPERAVLVSADRSPEAVARDCLELARARLQPRRAV